MTPAPRCAVNMVECARAAASSCVEDSATAGRGLPPLPTALHPSCAVLRALRSASCGWARATWLTRSWGGCARTACSRACTPTLRSWRCPPGSRTQTAGGRLTRRGPRDAAWRLCARHGLVAPALGSLSWSMYATPHRHPHPAGAQDVRTYAGRWRHAQRALFHRLPQCVQQVGGWVGAWVRGWVRSMQAGGRQHGRRHCWSQQPQISAFTAGRGRSCPECQKPPADDACTPRARRAGALGEAERAWRDMLQGGVTPDLITYSAMIDACAKASQGD